MFGVLALALRLLCLLLRQGLALLGATHPRHRVLPELARFLTLRLEAPSAAARRPPDDRGEHEDGEHNDHDPQDVTHGCGVPRGGTRANARRHVSRPRLLREAADARVGEREREEGERDEPGHLERAEALVRGVAASEAREHEGCGETAYESA